jgi:hypothetical protein
MAAGRQLITDGVRAAHGLRPEALELQRGSRLDPAEVAPGALRPALHTEPRHAEGVDVACDAREVEVAPRTGGERLDLPPQLVRVQGAQAVTGIDAGDVPGVVERARVRVVAVHEPRERGRERLLRRGEKARSIGA